MLTLDLHTGKHPLENSWTFWYDHRGGGKTAGRGSRPKGEKKNWENNLKVHLCAIDGHVATG